MSNNLTVIKNNVILTGMYHDILIHAGLDEKEALVYEALLELGKATVKKLVDVIRLKRGDVYNVLYRLLKKKLISETVERGTAHFVLEHPVRIAEMIEERKRSFAKTEESLAELMPKMKAQYLVASERPTIQFYEGEAGLKKIYEDTLAVADKKAYLVRTHNAMVYSDLFGDWFRSYLERRAAKGITLYALTPDHFDACHDPAIDAARKMVRTWIRPEDYTTQMEVTIFGNTTCFISYGIETFAIALEHAPLAQAMKELFALAEKGARTLSIIHDHA